MNNSLVNLVAAELRQFFREPQIMFWSFCFPLILVWILGIAFSGTEVKEKTVGILLSADTKHENDKIKAWASEIESQEHTLSRVIDTESVKRDYLIKTKYKFKYYNNREETIQGLKRGEIQIFLEKDENDVKHVYYLDPQNSDALLIYFLLSDNIDPMSRTMNQNMSVIESPGLRYVDYLIPGLIAMAIMEACLMAISWQLVEKRVTKVTRQMIITPMKRYEFLSAHILACFLFGFVEILVVFLFALAYFDVQVQGGIIPFLSLIICGNICFAGIAVLVASRAKKAQTASGILEVALILLIAFSGIFFSYKEFPTLMVLIVEKLPLTILADSMRMVFIEGAGLMDIMHQCIVLTLIGVVSFIVGLKIFRWS